MRKTVCWLGHWRREGFPASVCLLGSGQLICAYLSLNWSGQRWRIQRDPVLSKLVMFVRVTRMNCTLLQSVLSDPHLPEESFGWPSTSGGIEEEIQGVTRRIQSAIQIQPLPVDLDVGPIHLLNGQLGKPYHPSI
jgi:hypothetical protein